MTLEAHNGEVSSFKAPDDSNSGEPGTPHDLPGTPRDLPELVLRGLDAYVAGQTDTEGLLDAPGKSMANETAMYSFQALYSLMLHQATEGAKCWMNLGLKDAPPEQAYEALFVRMFEGQEAWFSREGVDVLDTSSGYGDQYLALRDRMRKLSYVGVNLDNWQNLFAARRTGFRVPFFTMSAGSIGVFPAERFDIVISHENAFHYKSRRHYLANVHRLLKHGGMLFMHDVLSYGRIKHGQGLHTIAEYKAYAESLGFEVVMLKDVRGEILMNNLSAAFRSMGTDIIDGGPDDTFYIRVQLRKR